MGFGTVSGWSLVALEASKVPSSFSDNSVTVETFSSSSGSSFVSLEAFKVASRSKSATGPAKVSSVLFVTASGWSLVALEALTTPSWFSDNCDTGSASVTLVAFGVEPR